MTDRRPARPEEASDAHGEEAEISKQDALRETGISYGQFYRWKRIGLIPESWFRRRATFTGQETFLPREKLLERIRRIQGLKDRHSLEDIARMLSPDVVSRSYSPAEVESMTWISERARSLLPDGGTDRELSFLDLLCLMLIEHLLGEDALADRQIGMVADTLCRRLDDVDSGGAERRLTLLLKEGMASAALHSGTCVFDEGTQVLTSISIDSLIEELKLRLRGLAA
jgi:hypothetical protein